MSGLFSFQMQYVQFQDDRATKDATAQLVTLHQLAGIS